MLARLQRAWVALLLTLAGAIGLWAMARGVQWWMAALVSIALLHVHAVVLALEFVALSRVEPGGDVPKAGAWSLARAWWGEIWTGFMVFGWRQPFRSEAIADLLPQGSHQTRRPLLLVHGFVCNRGLWNPWMHRLSRAGVPFVAVNLEPVFGSIDAYVATIETAIRRLQGASPHKPIIVAHSMGGLATRAWMVRHGGLSRVHGVVTIGSPHAGTALARFGLSRNAKQMRPGSEWLQALQSAETAAERARFICFFSHCDNIVVPASTAMLPDADNRHVPGVAHVHLAFQPQVLEAVMAWAKVAAGEPSTADSPEALVR